MTTAAVVYGIQNCFNYKHFKYFTQLFCLFDDKG